MRDFMEQNNYLKELNLSQIIKTSNLAPKSSDKASIIIVTYNTRLNLFEKLLNSLKNQTIKDFELLIIDNSDRTDLWSFVSNCKLKLSFIKLNRNYGLSLARNVGIKYARGEIIIFLDDDAIPAKNFVEEHIKAHERYKIFGLRGKALPKSQSIFNYLPRRYNCGNEIIPSIIDLEGNSSFKREILLEIGGFNPSLNGAGGGEGLELTYRIIKKYGDKKKVIYYPKAIIYHDFCLNFFKYINKVIRHMKHAQILQARFPDIYKFVASYKGDLRKEYGNLRIKIKLQLKILQLIKNLILKLLKFTKNWKIDFGS
ncbi:MAG: glycosyltransferase family 2 protein [Candidatus Helarchaeota archaeon]